MKKYQQQWFSKLLWRMTPKKGKRPLSVRQRIRSAAWQCAGLSSICALAPGPFGALTLLPELAGTTRIQLSMIKDIAVFYNVHNELDERVLALLYANELNIPIAELEHRGAQALIMTNLVPKATRILVEQVGTRLATRRGQRGLGRWVGFLIAPYLGYTSWRLTAQLGQRAEQWFAKGKPLIPEASP